MQIQRINTTLDMGECYLVGEPGQPCFLVDFGVEDGARVASYCASRHGFLAAILLTHGHYDHIAGLRNVELDPNTRVVIHGEDEAYLYDARLNASKGLFGQEFVVEKALPLYLCEDEDVLTLGARQGQDEQGNRVAIGGYEVEVLHTPFHTGGSVCYYLKEEGVLFSGDTLFHGGIGRYDLPGAKPRLVEASLRRLAKLPPDTKVYPGHGPSTTIGQELRYNPHFQGLK